MMSRFFAPLAVNHQWLSPPETFVFQVRCEWRDYLKAPKISTFQVEDSTHHCDDCTFGGELGVLEDFSDEPVHRLQAGWQVGVILRRLFNLQVKQNR